MAATPTGNGKPRPPRRPAARPTNALLARQGSPWTFGPYRIVVQRRVTEEEQISVECYEQTLDEACHTYAVVMESMRHAMIAHNERVVLVHQDRLVKLERMIENRAQELQELDHELAAKKAEAANGPDAVTPA